MDAYRFSGPKARYTLELIYCRGQGHKMHSKHCVLFFVLNTALSACEWDLVTRIFPEMSGSMSRFYNDDSHSTPNDPS
ncbi:hypothetical protein SCLCIDRAFT_601553 [Scleroderma citrinum Foug A]|uniref:Uncharacterized protein n=1 Tax=Scleroderma citrinum Foug A TaxID=1036808 RepID=A0A0C2ZTT4_9AGAM|nr:hypothetical protein SCLCIDRAFT_601553 [Scleroderma citrinum Foug A]